MKSLLFFVFLSISFVIALQAAGAETDFLETDGLFSFVLTIQPADWAQMQPKRQGQFRPAPPPLRDADPGFRPSPPGPPPDESEFEYVKGVVKYGDEVYHDVGIRFKGNSSFRTVGQSIKKPFKLDFDRFVKDQTFHGHKTLNFSNGFKDASLMREKLAYDLFKKVGVPAPRAAYARLYLTVEGVYDREYLGLYTMVEQVDKRFLKERFGNGDGLLVKPDRIPDLVYFGEDWKNYERNYGLKSKKKTSDTAHFIHFIKFLNDAEDERFTRGVEEFFNVDSFLKFLAVNTLLVNLDSYVGTGHNYYLYHNTATGQYEMLPWDLNEAFGNFQMGEAREMLDLDIDRPSAGKKLLIDRLLKVERYKAQYHQHLKEIVGTHFNSQGMSAEIDRLHALIRGAVLADKHKQFSTEQFERSISENIAPQGRPGFPPPPEGQGREQRENEGRIERRPPPGPMLHEMIGLKPFVAKRVESVKAQLNGERRGHIIEQFRFGQPMRKLPGRK